MRLKFKIKLDGEDHDWGFINNRREGYESYEFVSIFRGTKETYSFEEMEKKLRMFIGKLSSDGEI
jgi:hypothetical protein